MHPARSHPARSHPARSHPVDVLEAACADAWPAVTERGLGRWRLRAAGGYTGRANSALVAGDPGVPLDAALAEVVAFAGEHGIRPYLQVVTGDAVEPELRARGWAVNTAHAKGAESHVLVGPTAPGQGPDGVDGVSVPDVPPPGWLEVAVGGDPTAAQRHVLTSGPRVGFATAYSGGAHPGGARPAGEIAGGEIAGVARGCVVRGYLHVAVLEVRPAHRRRGVATALLAALDRWAGVPHRVLQVSTDNAAAVALYRRAGLVESHRYRYWALSPSR